ncbi:MAG: alpha/beta fold hydrolase [Candidatus Hodarchaeota archaeon]
MTEQYADINNIKICYEIHGKGYPIIFIHGYGAKKETWIAQIGALSEKFKVIILDLRGTGKSDRPNMLYTMDLFADDVKGLMDFLNIKKAHIAGRSMGGMIAQHLVLKYPKSVDKIILITTTPGFPDEKGVELLIKGRIEQIKTLKKDPEKYFWQFARIVFHQKFRKEMESNPKKKFYGIWSAEDLINESIINPSNPQDIINQGNAIKKHNVLDKLSEINNKTLIIAASHDRMTPLLSMEEMHKRIPNSTLKVIQQAGHFCTLSRAPEVNQLILDFLKS